MRWLRLEEGTQREALEEALETASPVGIDLAGTPRSLGRRELLLLLARRGGIAVARLAGTVATPLAEAALLCDEALFPEGTRLDLEGALLSPIVYRLGAPSARVVLARFGSSVPARAVLRPHDPVASARRSPAALAAALSLLEGSRYGGEAAALAREKAAFRTVMSHPDRDEGVLAFRERRPPRFDW